MSNPSLVFEETYTDYPAQVNRLDLEALSSLPGLDMDGPAASLCLFDQRFSITAAGIVGPDGRRPGFDVCVILCKYLLLCPTALPRNSQWVTYQGLQHSGPLTGFFQNEVEQAIATFFAGRLTQCCCLPCSTVFPRMPASRP